MRFDVPPVANLLFQDDLPNGDYRFFQLGWVVDDLMAAMRQWGDVFGLGPFHVLPRRPTTWVYRGVETTIDMQTAFVQCGPVLMELIQQFDNEQSAYRDIFSPGEGGLHHMCTVTTEYDATLAHYRDRGYEVVAEMIKPSRVCYIDTSKDFGFMCEVLERTDGFIDSSRKIATTCANWQGEDPIRFLTRDGYRVPEEVAG